MKKSKKRKIIISLVILIILAIFLCVGIYIKSKKEDVGKDRETGESGEYTVIKENDKYGVIDNNENKIIPCEYKLIKDCSDGMFLVKNMDDKYGFMNTNGEIIVDFEYIDGYSFKNGIGVLTSDEGSTYFNTSGQVVGLPNCALEGEVGTYDTNDYLAIEDKDTGLYGYIDVQGNYKIPCKWQYVTNFCNGLALVYEDTGGYVIDMNENIIIPQNIISKYARITTAFDKGLLIVYKFDDSCGVLNKDGKEIIPCSKENKNIQVKDDYILVTSKNNEEIKYDFNGNKI